VFVGSTVSTSSVKSFIALCDSFTEGVGDPHPDGTCRGWADRFASHLAAAVPGLRYANLAIRGKVVSQVVAEQVPAAAALAPDTALVSRRRQDVQWARTYAAPWLQRRLRGVSTGDGMTPKRPELQPVEV
jgi:hypothetical protein